MRLIAFSAALAAIVAGTSAFAREADLLDFSRLPEIAAQQSSADGRDSGPRLDGLGSNPFAQAVGR